MAVRLRTAYSYTGLCSISHLGQETGQHVIGQQTLALTFHRSGRRVERPGRSGSRMRQRGYQPIRAGGELYGTGSDQRRGKSRPVVQRFRARSLPRARVPLRRPGPFRAGQRRRRRQRPEAHLCLAGRRHGSLGEPDRGPSARRERRGFRRHGGAAGGEWFRAVSRREGDPGHRVRRRGCLVRAPEHVLMALLFVREGRVHGLGGFRPQPGWRSCRHGEHGVERRKPEIPRGDRRQSAGLRHLR